MKQNYQRTNYGELYPANRTFEIWETAQTMIAAAAKRKKILPACDTILFDKKSRASGDAVHHEIYDIHPDPIRVLICVRETEGTKYGVRTTSKNYYIIKRHGKGVTVKPANKSKAAKAAKNAACELGCAINVVEGKAKLKLNRACPEGIAYKKVAVGTDGRIYSVYDGSPWLLGVYRSDKAMKNHNGGLYVYETAEQAKNAPFPHDSELKNYAKIIIKCHVAGNYCRYDEKLAFSHVMPINIESIL